MPQIQLRRAARFLRLWAAVLAFAVLVLPTLGSSSPVNPMDRFDKLGHQLMCSCGCGQILLECNHVGCPLSEGMRHELRAAMDAGQTDQQIYDTFIQKYGPTVMAAPIFHGFNILAWIMPVAFLLIGTFGAALLIHHWKQRSAGRAQPAPVVISDAMRDRIRRETEQ